MRDPIFAKVASLKERAELVYQQLQETDKESPEYPLLQQSYLKLTDVQISMMESWNKKKMKELGI